MTQILYTYIAEENHDYLIKKYLHQFPKNFQEKIMTFKRWQDAQLSLLGRLLLNYGLQKMNKEYQNEMLSYTSFDKPFFSTNKTKFNISHSGEIVVCALSETNDVGIDVEIISEINIHDFEAQMTKREWNSLMIPENKKAAFFDFWTQKEAVIKSHGKGLSIPLKSFEVTNYQAKIKEECFFLKEIFLDEKYKCHLAFKDEVDAIILGPNLVMLDELS